MTKMENYSEIVNLFYYFYQRHKIICSNTHCICKNSEDYSFDQNEWKE